MCACKGRRSSLFNAAKLFKVSVGFWLHVTDTKCSEKSDNVFAACCSHKAAKTLLGGKIQMKYRHAVLAKHKFPIDNTVKIIMITTHIFQF